MSYDLLASWRFFYFAPLIADARRNSSKTCFRALLVCWRLISSKMFSLNVAIGSLKNTFFSHGKEYNIRLIVPTLWNWYFIPFNAVKKYRTPSHAYFRQGERCSARLQFCSGKGLYTVTILGIQLGLSLIFFLVSKRLE